MTLPPEGEAKVECMSTPEASRPADVHAADCCSPHALWGWSPPDLPADTRGKQRVDRYLPRGGLPVVSYFVAVAVLLNVAHLLPPRWDLLVVALASGAAGGWCALNFWRCRHAHCVVTGAGWLGLAVFGLVEMEIGRSVIGDEEGAVFLGVLGAGLVFELTWRRFKGTNAVK